MSAYDIYQKLVSYSYNIVDLIKKYVHSNEFIEHLNMISKPIADDFRTGIEKELGLNGLDIDVSVGYVEILRYRHPALVVKIKTDIYRDREISCMERFRIILALGTSIYFKRGEYGIMIDHIHSRVEKDKDGITVKLCVFPHPEWLMNKMIIH